MNKDNERRMLIAFVLSSVILIAALYLMPRNKAQQQPTASQQQAEAVQPQAPQPSGQNITGVGPVFTANLAETNVSISNDHELLLGIDTFGGRITDININGKWNRLSNPVTLLNQPIYLYPGDTFFGSLDDAVTSTNRAVYSIQSQSSNSVTLFSEARIPTGRFIVSKTFTVFSNYIFSEEVIISNPAPYPLNLNFNGDSISLGASYSFSMPGKQNSGNIQVSEYYDGKSIHKVLAPKLLNSFNITRRLTNAVFPDPSWITFSDNYFLTVFKPLSSGINGKYLLIQSTPTNQSYILGIELPPVTLSPGESRKISVLFYTGPKKENLAVSFDGSLSKFFAWPAVFNLFMKPIEIAMRYVMNFIAIWVSNWGIVIILLAFFIKLILSPLSIRAAVSIRRSALLQPKIKALQEKFKNDPKILNEKMAELYRKEGINPLGGCLPMLLQIPVFFALYRVLATSVELRGAPFLWVKDLTMPDTLFTMNLPLLPHSFNLLPIIMTIIQIISMRLQSMRTPGGNQQQQTLNTFLLPVVFLFIFWSMPAGLVVYWTVQNFYTILEQEAINHDSKIKIK